MGLVVEQKIIEAAIRMTELDDKLDNHSITECIKQRALIMDLCRKHFLVGGDTSNVVQFRR